MVEEIERGKKIQAQTVPRRGEVLDFALLAEACNFFGPNSFNNYLQVRLFLYVSSEAPHCAVERVVLHISAFERVTRCSFASACCSGSIKV